MPARPPVCLANSLPKSGTHLLSKIIGLLPGMKQVELHLGPNPAAPDMTEAYDPSVEADADGVLPVGIGRPRLMPRRLIREMLAPLQPGTFITGHVPYSAGMASLLQELGIRVVSIVRDPRDVAVSRAKFVAKRLAGAWHENGPPITVSERIMEAIGGEGRPSTEPCLRNLRDRLESVLAWHARPSSLVTRFERLVGPHGGGARDVQLQEIARIAAHLSMTLTPEHIESVADRAFGGTGTFHNGVIGGWRDHFTDDHKRACKDLVGRHLIDLGYEKDLDW